MRLVPSSVLHFLLFSTQFERKHIFNIKFPRSTENLELSKASEEEEQLLEEDEEEKERERRKREPSFFRSGGQPNILLMYTFNKIHYISIPCGFFPIHKRGSTGISLCFLLYTSI